MSILAILYKNRKTRNISKLLERMEGLQICPILDIAEIPQKLRENPDHDTILVVGGDGSIAETVNSMDLDTQKLAIIPSGRGNGLARELGINDPKIAVKALKTGKIREIDLIECTYFNGEREKRRYIVSTSGIGFIAKSTLRAQALPRIGRSAYHLASLISAFSEKTIEGDLRIEDESPKECKFTNFVINNTCHVGSIKAFPKAEITDSLMDFYMAEKNSCNQLLESLYLLTGSKAIVKEPKFFELKGQKKELEISLKKPASLMLDGDIFGLTDKIRFSVLSKTLKIYA